MAFPLLFLQSGTQPTVSQFLISYPSSPFSSVSVGPNFKNFVALMLMEKWDEQRKEAEEVPRG